MQKYSRFTLFEFGMGIVCDGMVGGIAPTLCKLVLSIGPS